MNKTKKNPPKAVAGWCVASRTKNTTAPMIAEVSQPLGKLKLKFIITGRNYHKVRNAVNQSGKESNLIIGLTNHRCNTLEG